MTQTLNRCPRCGAATSLGGLCERCLEKADHKTNRQYAHAHFSWLSLLWSVRRPVFWVILLVVIFLGFQMTAFGGEVAAQVMGIPRPAMSGVFLGLLILSVAAAMTRPQWQGRLYRARGGAWLAFNLGVLTLGLVTGLPFIIGGVWLADQTLPPAQRLCKSTPPLWPVTQIALGIFPVYFAALLWGSF